MPVLFFGLLPWYLHTWQVSFHSSLVKVGRAQGPSCITKLRETEIIKSTTHLPPCHSDCPYLALLLRIHGWISEECVTFFFFEVSDLKEVCDSKNVKNHCSTLCWEVGSWGQFPRWRNGVQAYLMSTMWASKGSWRRWRRKGNWEKGDGFWGKYLEGCTIFSWPSPYSGW